MTKNLINQARRDPEDPSGNMFEELNIEQAEIIGASAFDLLIAGLPDLEGWRRDHPSPVKMFKALSIINTSRYGPRKMYWHVVNRDYSAVKIPYEAYIYNYYSPGLGEIITRALQRGEVHFHEEELVLVGNVEALNECFTEDEIIQFKDYLKDDETLHVEEIKPPFYSNIGSSGYLFPGDLDYDMSKESSYNLPFEVNGNAFLY